MAEAELEQEEVNLLMHLEEEHARAVEDLLASDEEDELPAEVLDYMRQEPALRARIEGYVADTVPAYMDDDFRGHFRMTRGQVDCLMDELGAEGAFVDDDHGGMEPLPREAATLLLLWTLANQDTIRSVADRFNVTKSTVIRSNRRLTSVLVDPLMQKHIHWPANDVAADAMDPTGTINMVGAIDGSHIPISQPVEQQEVYVNRKGFHSLVLQAVCQWDMSFIDVFTGYPGSVHDARVFRNSPLCDAIDQLCGEEYFIAGDSAYPLTRHVITPFKDNGRLSWRQRRFNTELSKKRVIIERAFAILKGRFRRLKFLKMWAIPDTVKTIIAACVLHNMCLRAGDNGEDMEADRQNDAMPVENAEDAAVPDAVDDSGVAVRNRLMLALLGNE